MTRSRTVTLTLVAGLGLLARAQQTADPCDAASFNPKVCKAAIRRGGYCSQGAWVPASYQQKYPYYYDLYQSYVAQGGVVSPADVCASSGFSHGGFGSTGAGSSAHC